MARIDVEDLSIRFPVYGSDSRSLKKHVARIAIGGRLGMEGASTPIVAALTGVTLKIEAGDRVALVGPNGSGKTTLLRAIAGVYSPDDGHVAVEGKIASLLDLALGIDPSATGYENIRLRGLVAGLSSAEIKAKEEQIAEFSGLGPFLSFPVKTYSAGMQARLAFATATSVDADILLMDEWIAVGDAEFKTRAHDRLTGLVERSHIVVLASHDAILIKSLCNKMVWMDHGSASDVMPIEQYDEYVSRMG